jgi:ABC-type multidrug transport system ATPase subunit
VLGKVLINNRPDKLSLHKFITGFVPQEDVMIRELSVYDTLMFAARCRLDRGMSHAQIKQVVDQIVSDLDLEDVLESNIGDENIRGISGGQRKRVNLGIEMVALPSILLLDEPTSGLDSTGSMDMVHALRLGLFSLFLMFFS